MIIKSDPKENHFSKFLNYPTKIYTLVYFRIAFGLVMLYEYYRWYDSDRFYRYYIEPKFHFKYFFFEWVQVLDSNTIYLLSFLMGLSTIFIIFGYYYKLFSFLFFITYTYFFLSASENYNNHYYLTCLISFLLFISPANYRYSLDNFFLKNKNIYIKSWSVFLLKFQISIVYIFGGIAKLNKDWLNAKPLDQWLSNRYDVHFLGNFLLKEWVWYFFSYTGLLIDLFIIPLLLNNKTKKVGVLIYLAFNYLNYSLFNIGIFPLFMSFSLPILVIPIYKNVNMRTLKLKFRVLPLFKVLKGVLSSLFTINIFSILSKKLFTLSFLTVFITIYICWQTLYPLRHYVIKGNASWTEEAHYFSWRMKLRSKKSTLSIYADNSDINSEIILEKYLTKKQISEFRKSPDMILQFLLHLKELSVLGESYSVQSFSSLNARNYRRLILEYIDLNNTNRLNYSNQPFIILYEN